MHITGKTLFAFVDPKDPFMPSGLAGEDQPGPILSLLGSRQFDFLFLFHTPHTRDNAAATACEVERRYPQCHVALHDLPVTDPKDYSVLMGRLAREVRGIARLMRDTENYVCVSSGTAEMRAAWFLLTATGVLPATLLQIGSPAEPLFGAANVKEVRLGSSGWESLRDLVMPLEYFRGPTRMPEARDDESEIAALSSAAPPKRMFFQIGALDREPAPVLEIAWVPELDDALQELGIFIGSAIMREAAERAAVAATSDFPVLILGETGTGKEVFAKLIHRLSVRRDAPIIAVNCGAIPKELVESELFGHVKGAFTGALKDHKGRFEQAHGGTLLLDEIGELPLEAQAKILRVVQDGVVEPVGSGKPRKVSARIIAATNRNIKEEVAAGRFREDLYYRLEVVPIELPPLRARRSEIPALALAFLKHINQRLQRPKQLSKEALRRLERHDWPGNVRELSNVLQRSVLYSRGEVLEADDLLITEKPAGPDLLSTLPEPEPGFDIEQFLRRIRNHLFQRALAKSNGSQAGAAALLGVSKQAVSKFVNGGGNQG